MLVVLVSLIVSILILANSASARVISESVTTNSPWPSLALTALFAAGLYVAMTWGDKRESYKA